MTTPRGPRAVIISDRLYRLLLRAYPHHFRHAYQDGIAQIFRDSCRGAYRTGGLHGLAPPPTWLAQLALRVAAGKGDSQPWSAGYVEATRRAAAAATSDSRLHADEKVYFVLLRGDFVHNRHPYGVPPPTGSVLTFTVDPATQEIYDVGMSNRVPDLSVLGRPYRLPLAPATH